MANLSIEELRRSFKPKTVNVLFIGESPPSNGTFFYKADSNLFDYTQVAFSQLYNEGFESGFRFLEIFRDLGCYLDDLILIPNIDNQGNVFESLACRIRDVSPRAVVTVMIGIVPAVWNAYDQSGIEARLYTKIPFPAYGHQQRFVSNMVDVLQELQRAAILPSKLYN